jgi:hypothetical protein
MRDLSRKTLKPLRGAVLFLALIFMLMLALVAATIMQTAVLQLHMAGNDQFLEEAIHRAQAIVTELSLNPEHFTLDGGVGHTNCPSESQFPGCDQRDLEKPRLAQVPVGVTVEYRVTRQAPPLWKTFPFRESQDRVSSSANFGAATFEISARVDGSENRLGNAHVVQGIAVKVPIVR